MFTNPTEYISLTHYDCHPAVGRGLDLTPGGCCLHRNPSGDHRDQFIDSAKTIYVAKISLYVRGLYRWGYHSWKSQLVCKGS